MKLSGVPDSLISNGKAAVPSGPVKPVAQTGDSSGNLISTNRKAHRRSPPVSDQNNLSFLVYANERRAALREENKNVVEITREEWKKMSDKQKAPYKEVAKKNKETYLEAMGEYKRTKEEIMSQKKEEEELLKLQKHEALQLLKKKEKKENLIKKKKETKKKNENADPNKPKKPASSFIFFSFIQQRHEEDFDRRTSRDKQFDSYCSNLCEMEGRCSYSVFTVHVEAVKQSEETSI